MRPIALISGMLLGGVSHGCALTVAKGVVIETAAGAMAESGHKRIYLQRVPLDHGEEFLFWSVKQGVVIARYSKGTRKIGALAFSIADSTPKTKGESVDLKLAAFDTKTGMFTTACGQRIPRIKPEWHLSCEICRSNSKAVVPESAPAEPATAGRSATGSKPK